MRHVTQQILKICWIHNLTQCFHLGYLSYDENTKEVFIPNNEILEEFIVSTKNDQWNVLINKLNKSKILLQETLNKNEKLVAKLLKEAHDTSLIKI